MRYPLTKQQVHLSEGIGLSNAFWVKCNTMSIRRRTPKQTTPRRSTLSFRLKGLNEVNHTTITGIWVRSNRRSLAASEAELASQQAATAYRDPHNSVVYMPLLWRGISIIKILNVCQTNRPLRSIPYIHRHIVLGFGVGWLRRYN